MASQDGGAIVAITASFSVRQEGNPAYGAAKGGIIAL
jgi:NAD(P)-dependent dehydrogenase (short-subunit alcohol dehydrogenase family)